MTRGEAAVLEHLPHRRRQPEKAHRVGDVNAALADDARQILLRVLKFLEQPAIAFGLLERRQILALHILDERHFEHLAVGELADDDRHFVELRRLRRAPAPLARDDLVGVGDVGMLAHQERLKNALGTDRFDERGETLLVEMAAWLVAAGVELLDRHGAWRACRRFGGAGGGLLRFFFGEESGEPAAETAPARVFTHAAVSRSRSRRSTSPARCT